MYYVTFAATCLLRMSILAFSIYSLDKVRAQRHGWRVPEKLQLAVGFLGGAPGALLAMIVLRHKTKYKYFWGINLAGLAWQAGLMLWMLIYFGRILE